MTSLFVFDIILSVSSKNLIKRWFQIAKDLQINDEIRDKEILLVDENGPIGVRSSDEGRRLAFERKLDLVKIAPNASPPVCKIMDYGKFCFDRKKKEKEAKKKQRTIEIKEIKLSVRIDVGDLNTKCNRTREFISAGNKVKVSVKFRGRELQHTELGFDVLSKFYELCKDFAEQDGKPALESKQVSVVLVQKNSKSLDKNKFSGKNKREPEASARENDKKQVLSANSEKN